MALPRVKFFSNFRLSIALIIRMESRMGLGEVVTSQLIVGQLVTGHLVQGIVVTWSAHVRTGFYIR